MGFPDSAAGWRRYAGFLAELAANTSEQAKLEFDRLSSGWAIGTQAWRSALAKEYQQLSLHPGLERRELRMLREEQWRESFDRVMAELGKPREALANEASDVGWKIAAAARLRSRGVPYSWIGRELILRCDSKLRGQVFQFRRAHGTDGPRGGDSQQSTP
jgi:putative transposase